MEHGVLQVAGCPIAWCGEGDPTEKNAIVLLHGARAHRHWWSAAVQAGLGRDRRVVGIDLSGHGDSGRRSDYTPEMWADEALAAIEQCAGGHAALVGHSMGGLVALVAAARRPDVVSGLVLVDTRIHLSEREAARVPRGTPAKIPRTFSSRKAAVESVRLFPPQPVVNAEVVRQVAQRSIGGVGGEWSWKFDPAIAQRFNDELINRYLAAVECPVAMVYGELSALVDASSARDAEAILRRPVPTTIVSGAHHHLILDRPGASAGAIAGALAAGTVSPPNRPPS
jgi:pimeloyl-ACP methyl ester carboxylesterase